MFCCTGDVRLRSPPLRVCFCVCDTRSRQREQSAGTPGRAPAASVEERGGDGTSETQ